MRPRLLPRAAAPLRGRAAVPTSKSLTNRALIAAAVADGGEIRSPLDCDDTRVLARALGAAGWPVEWSSSLEVGRRVMPADGVRLDLGESGTGARLVLGLMAAVPGTATIDGSARLRERPMEPLLAALGALGAAVSSSHGRLPVRVEGRRLDGGAAQVRPELSSQFVSALLLAAPLMRRGLELEVVGPLPSRPYLDLTAEVLRAFGSDVATDCERRRWRVPGGGLRATEFTVEGDWSAAAFLLAAAATAGGEIVLGPLDCRSLQGDRMAVAILERAGLVAAASPLGLVVRGPVTAPVRADLEASPDLFPALAAVAAAAPPGSRLTGLQHLGHKESDRLAVMVENLRRLGCRLEVEPSAVTVLAGVRRGDGSARPVTAANDHRIAMAMAVVALTAGPLRLDDGDCVGKSFPGFWGTWDALLEGSSGGRE